MSKRSIVPAELGASGDLPSPEVRVLQHLAACRVIAVATIADPRHAEATSRALLAGGLSCIEITLRTPGAAEAIREARRVQGMLVGAGTVLSNGVAHGALAMTTPGDTSMSTLDEVERLMLGQSARVVR